MKKSIQNVGQEKSESVLIKNKNNVSNINTKTDTEFNRLRSNPVHSATDLPKNTERNPLTQTMNDIPNEPAKEQQVKKHNLKADTIIKYDTTLVSKKKVKFKWSSNK